MKSIDNIAKINLTYAIVAFASTFYLICWLPYAYSSLVFDWSIVAKVSSIYWIGSIVGEIPTGFITDRFGSKNALLCYFSLSLISAGMIQISTTYPAFLLSHFIYGVSLSFLTGVFSLRIKEEERHYKLDVNYKMAISQGGMFRAIASILGVMLGWVSIKIASSNISILMSTIIWFLSIIYTILSLETLPVLFTEKNKSNFQQFTDGAKIFWNNKMFLKFSFSRIVLDFSTAAILEFGITLVAPNLVNGSNQYLIYSIIFTSIRLLSSKFISIIKNDRVYLLYVLSFILGILLTVSKYHLVIVPILSALIFIFFYIDYLLHANGLECLDESGASMALSIQNLLMSLASASSFYLYSKLLHHLDSNLAMSTILLSGLLLLGVISFNNFIQSKVPARVQM